MYSQCFQFLLGMRFDAILPVAFSRRSGSTIVIAIDYGKLRQDVYVPTQLFWGIEGAQGKDFII